MGRNLFPVKVGVHFTGSPKLDLGVPFGSYKGATQDAVELIQQYIMGLIAPFGPSEPVGAGENGGTGTVNDCFPLKSAQKGYRA